MDCDAGKMILHNTDLILAIVSPLVFFLDLDRSLATDNCLPVRSPRGRRRESDRDRHRRPKPFGALAQNGFGEARLHRRASAGCRRAE